MTAMRGCLYCKNGWMRWDRYACAECIGENSRNSYKERSASLFSSIRDAAIEEMRVRAACNRMRSAL